MPFDTPCLRVSFLICSPDLVSHSWPDNVNWWDWHGGGGVSVVWGGQYVDGYSAVVTDVVFENCVVNVSGLVDNPTPSQLVEIGGGGLSIACGDFTTAAVADVSGTSRGNTGTRPGVPDCAPAVRCQAR